MCKIVMFKTHKGRLVFGKRLQAALEAVADDWAQLARDIREEDAYASHVTEEMKDQFLAEGLARAEEIRQGYVRSVVIAQRVDTKLTGVCVPFLRGWAK